MQCINCSKSHELKATGQWNLVTLKLITGEEFYKKSSKKWNSKISFRPLFVFQKSFIYGKSKCPEAYFQYISVALNLTYNKNKFHKTLHYWSRDMFNFDFLEKAFSRKMLIIFYPINWPHFIVWLPLVLQILGNIYIAIVCFPGCHTMSIKFEISLIFLIKLFLYMTKKSRQKD